MPVSSLAASRNHNLKSCATKGRKPPQLLWLAVAVMDNSCTQLWKLLCTCMRDVQRRRIGSIKFSHGRVDYIFIKKSPVHKTALKLHVLHGENVLLFKTSHVKLRRVAQSEGSMHVHCVGHVVDVLAPRLRVASAETCCFGTFVMNVDFREDVVAPRCFYGVLDQCRSMSRAFWNYWESARKSFLMPPT